MHTYQYKSVYFGVILICWFDDQETFIIINVESICDTFFRVLWWIESLKEQHLFEI